MGSPPVSQRPAGVMPMGTTVYPASSSASMTLAALASETSCSLLRPPKTTPTRIVFPVYVLIRFICGHNSPFIYNHSPTSCTSGVNSTPKRSWTVVWMRSIRPDHIRGGRCADAARIDDEIGVPPAHLDTADACALQPRSFDQPPGKVAGRVDKGAAQARLDRLRAAPVWRYSAARRSISSRSPSANRKLALRTTGLKRGPQRSAPFEAAVAIGVVECCHRHFDHLAVGVDNPGIGKAVLDLAAVCARVAHHRAAHCAGDAHRPFQPGQAAVHARAAPRPPGPRRSPQRDKAGRRRADRHSTVPGRSAPGDSGCRSPARGCPRR